MHGAIRLLVRMLVHGFYRIRRSADGIPAGPLVLVSNHTNGLVDGGLFFDLSRRPIRFLVKYTLLDIPLLGRLVAATRAVPVFRQKDQVSMTNDEAFRAVHAALAGGEVIGIFPEGTSRSAPRIHALKTGAARMALGAEAENGFALGVRILPVGYAYEAPRRFRSRAEVLVGEPLSVKPYAAEFAADPRAAAVRLTAEIAAALRDLTLHVKEEGDARRVALLEHALPPDGRMWSARRAALARLACDLRDRAPERAVRRAERLDRLSDDLTAAGLEQLRVGPPGPAWRWPIAALLLVPGALLVGPPWLLARSLGRLRSVPPDKEVTVALLTSVLLFPLAFAVTFLAVTTTLGTPTALAVLALQLLALAAVPWAWQVVVDRWDERKLARARSADPARAARLERRLAAAGRLAACTPEEPLPAV